MACVYKANRDILREAFRKIYTNTKEDLIKTMQSLEQSAIEAEHYYEIVELVDMVNEKTELLGKLETAWENLTVCKNPGWVDYAGLFVYQTCNGGFDIEEEEGL